MTVLAWVFAGLAAVVYGLVFVWEGLLFERPWVHRGIFSVDTADVPTLKLWTFGVSFYNLALALGALVGVGLWMAGYDTVGRTLVVYVSACMVMSGLVLLAADRMAMGRPRGAGLGGAAAAGLPALVALVATLLTLA